MYLSCGSVDLKWEEKLKQVELWCRRKINTKENVLGIEASGIFLEVWANVGYWDTFLSVYLIFSFKTILIVLRTPTAEDFID